MTTLKTLKHCSTTGYKQTDHVFTFSNSKEYCEFRREWRENYKDLSARIRYGKTHRKTSRPDYDQTAAWGLHALRCEARLEMNRIMAAKEEGNKRRLAAMMVRDGLIS